ncbi:hypothetical protein GOV05_03350 [Candidatus Woesearchaeota archaeon]|nr:hypothetical protein [Candidatus Woesearchaeota archaeon]
METLEAIGKRRSIKKFLDNPVDMTKIGVILDAGAKAPNAGNLQDYRFIVIKDKAVIEGVARACLHQTWIAGAPLIIVIGSKGEKTAYYYKEQKDMFVNHNCAAAAMNMILATTDLGLSTTWVGAFSEVELRNVLGMPGDVTPQVVLPIGYADEEVPEPAHYKLENFIFLEKWGNKIKDKEWLLKDYNILGRSIQKAEGLFSHLQSVFKDIGAKFKRDSEKAKIEKKMDAQEIPEELSKAKEEVDKKD